MKIEESFAKAIMVIDSCTTLNHTQVAKRYINLYPGNFDNYELLYNRLCKKIKDIDNGDVA